MPSLSGALGGASTGAEIGSFAGPWGTVIGAGIGGLVGLFTGGKSKLQKNIEGTFGPVKDNLINWSGENMDMNRLFRQLGLDQSQGVDKYLRGVLSSNDNQAFNSLVGPQKNAISQQYQQVLQNVSQFAPRGGGRGAASMSYDFDKAGKMLDVTAQARNQAVGQLSQAAGQNTSQALQFGQQATGQENAVLASLTGLMGASQNQQVLNSQQNGQSAYNLGQLLGPLLGNIFKKGSGGGWTPVGPGE